MNLSRFKREVIQGKSLNDVSSLTEYRACTFYLDSLESKETYGIKYEIMLSSFDNCSFRNDAYFDDLRNCQFTNCNFSGDFALSLDNEDINFIPSYIFSLCSLSQLSIFFDLEGLSSKIAQLTSLKKLFIFNYTATTLPSEIAKLTSLEELFIPSGTLESLPEEIRLLSSLKRFILPANYLNSEQQKRIKKLLPNCYVNTFDRLY